MNDSQAGPVLVVEDEPKIAQLLIDYLARASYETHWLSDGGSAVPWTRKHSPRLILLDILLPNKDGMEICREIRTFSLVPIIMITARIEEIDRLIGLEAGADDYICKPFSPREVIARVRAILRRVANQSAPGNGYLGLEIDLEQHSASVNGHLLDLTPVEFRLLDILLSHPGRVYSRDQLLDKVYDGTHAVSDRTIDSHVKNLRRKIHEIQPNEELIRTVYGVGYKLE